MRQQLVEWLACPMCRGPLNLASRGDNEIITTGALTCARCSTYYPILNGVPRLLTYETAITRQFAQKYDGWIAAMLTGFNPPNRTPPPGEETVLRNFSSEWTNYKWNGETYWDSTPENMLQIMRYILGTRRYKLAGRLVLEVGIGIGGIADAISKSEDCEIIGMDLGYSVDQAQQLFANKNSKLHVVQASAFAPPFPRGLFDYVYSQGVLHHTHSTVEAFHSISSLAKPSGMLAVWLYSNEMEQSSRLSRIKMMVENVARPIIARLPTPVQTPCLLPAVPVYMLHQALARDDRKVRYGWNEAMHAARDRLTPLYAHRHSYEEVSEWFKLEGYGLIECLRDEPRPRDVPEQVQLNVGIRGVRLAA